MNAARATVLVWCGVILAAAGCAMPQSNDWAGKSSEPGARTPRPVAPEVKAGWADDNAQYNYYLGYLDRFSGVPALKVDVSGRIVFSVTDSQGRCVPNCELTVCSPDGRVLCRRTTYPDGRAMFFLHEGPDKPPSTVKVLARLGTKAVSRDVDLDGPRTVELRFDQPREAIQQVPLDVAFVIDTTGSMGDELAKLKATLEAIHYQVTQLRPKPDARFGMVLYRDRGDEYVTRLVPFTADIDRFARELRAVTAGGGGDNPEDLQEALRVADGDLKWRPDAVRMLFVLGDAPPHLDYGQKFTYADFMRRSAQRGIKVTTIGASGLNETGEYVFRQLAQYTMGLFVFLTYGEKGESGPPTPWTVSHHTGENWESRNLDAIIVQSISRELSHLSDTPVALPEDYFEARPGEGVGGKAVLEDLFVQCARQLVDFSQSRIEPGTACGVLAAAHAGDVPPGVAETLGDQLGVALSRQKSFRLVDRQNLKQVLDELKLQEAMAFDADMPVARGQHVPAKVLVLSKVRRAGDRYEMLVKLVRVQTGEVLSATMLKLDKRLLE